MKVCFLVPPGKNKIPDRIFGCNYAFFFQHNIFMLYAATLLEENGHEVTIADCVVEKKPFEKVLEKKFQCYVFYSVFLSREEDLASAKKIEKRNSLVPIIFMGSDPTYYPEKYLSSANHFVVRGEPEYTLLELISKINSDLSKVKSISWKKGGEIVHNPPRKYIENLDKLPHPKRKLLKKPFNYYNSKFKKLPSTTLITSRGCSFNCYFCVPNSLTFARELEFKKWHKKKPPVTIRSPDDIAVEFQELTKEGYKSVFILDDQFVWGKKRTMEILDKIKDLNLEISLLARSDLILSEDLVAKMAKAGVSHVDLGVESFSQKILDYVRKDLDVKTIEQSVRLLKRFGIEPEINVLLGSCPLETKKTIKNTLEKVESLDVEIVHAKVCSPFPGTDFYYQAKENGWMITEDYVPIDPASESLISYPHLSRKELVESVRRFYRQHYFRPQYLVKQAFKIKSLKELKNKLKTAFNIRKNIFRGNK